MRKILLIIFAALLFSACSHTKKPTTLAVPTATPSTQPSTTMPEVSNQSASVSATIKTSMGDIAIRLFPDKAPTTVANFTGLSTGTKSWTDPKTGQTKTTPLYNNTIFHRVIDGFMIQGGDPLGTGTGGPGYKFADEVSPDLVFDRPYLLAMANAGPNTNGSQFFITVVPTPWLNSKHTIFGEVIDGQAIVDKIAKTPVDGSDRPLTTITITQILITEE